jgi:phthalate 4,5-dioxygenase
MRAEEQELLVRTGPGTPCGRLLREYWQPVALSSELPARGAPIPVTIFGEELVLFRDPAGQLGLIARRCRHRGVDMCYGRIESHGLRCIYHGWLYDRMGRCIEQPGVAAAASVAAEAGLTAYPCQEAGGLVFAYLGGGTPPLFPRYDFLDTAEEERYVAKIFHKCNYFQAIEGDLDQVHLSFLHRLAPVTVQTAHLVEAAPGSSAAPLALLVNDTAPTIHTQRTGFGMREIVARAAPDGVYVKVENFAFPGFAAVPGSVHGQGGYQVNWHVPVDDRSHWKYMIVFRRGGLDQDDIHRSLMADVPFCPDHRFAKPGLLYPQDRAAMEEGLSFAGLGTGFAYHDLVICEAQGEIYDRTQEYLGGEDKSIALVRRVMLEAIAAIQAGREAPHVVREPARNHFPDLMVLAEVIPASLDPRRFVDERLTAAAIAVPP